MAFNVAVNYLSVVIASVVSFIVGFIWYGPLFGKLWMKLSNISEKDAKKAKEKGMAVPMLLNFIGTLVTAYVLAAFLQVLGAGTVSGAMAVAFWAWLGFIAATTLLGGVLWENKSWNLFLLNGGYWLVTVEVIAAMLVWLG